MANESTHGLNITAGSDGLSSCLVQKENTDIPFGGSVPSHNLSNILENIIVKEEIVSHKEKIASQSPPYGNEDDNLLDIVKEKEFDVKHHDITFQEEYNTYFTGSDNISCGLVKKENMDVNFVGSRPFHNLSKKSENINIQEEKVSYSPPYKNEYDHLLGIVKEEELDIKHHDITFQEENYSETTDNLHNVILLPFETAKQGSLKKRINSSYEECYNKCYVGYSKCCQDSTSEQHLRYTYKKSYKCNSCSYECSQISNLKNHVRIHTGDKPYKCNICSYECSQHSSLKRHLRIHTGEKPYKCNSCSYECSQISNLKNHVRIHTGDKPYK